MNLNRVESKRNGVMKVFFDGNKSIRRYSLFVFILAKRVLRLNKIYRSFRRVYKSIRV